jgi:hypothetical protein
VAAKIDGDSPETSGGEPFLGTPPCESGLPAAVCQQHRHGRGSTERIRRQPLPFGPHKFDSLHQPSQYPYGTLQ